MLVRSSLLAASVAAFAASAVAQVVSSGPLAQVDPWGVGWLGQADGALPAEIWHNSDATTLEPLMKAIDPAALSPAGQTALRKLMMSSVRSPEGGDALIPHRLRLLEQLGETARADDLRGRFPDTEWGQGGKSRAAGLALLDGRARTQCARIADEPAGDPAWMPARALCYTIAEDYNAAALLGEQAADVDPDGSTWLLSAIENKRGPARRPPEGRFSTPFEAAVSLETGLAAPLSTLARTPADIAAIMLRNPAASLEQRRAVLPAAVDGGHATTADIVAFYNQLMDTDDAAQSEPLPVAIASLNDEMMAPADRATLIATALTATKTAADFRLASLALIDGLRKLTPGPDTAEQADLFARASVAASDPVQAAAWRTAMSEPEAWSAARLDVALALAGAPPADLATTISALLAASPLAEDAERPSGAAARAAFDTRLSETTRILFLMVGTGRPLPPEARARLSDLRTTGSGVSDPALLRIQAANDAAAPGEAALAAISLLGPDPSAMSFVGLADLLTQLRDARMGPAADAIALEAMQVWKTF